jgi:hypothetical protein
MKRLAALLMLTSCSVYTVHDARQAMLDTPLSDLLACAGIPQGVQKLSDNELLVQYQYKPANGALMSLKILTVVDASFGREPACDARFRVLRDGTVSGVSFGQTELSSLNSSCSKLITECVINPDQTDLPKWYDAFAILLPSDKKVSKP